MDSHRTARLCKVHIADLQAVGQCDRNRRSRPGAARPIAVIAEGGGITAYRSIGAIGRDLGITARIAAERLMLGDFFDN